jgi:lambda family phage tail tape measure protein
MAQNKAEIKVVGTGDFRQFETSLAAARRRADSETAGIKKAFANARANATNSLSGLVGGFTVAAGIREAVRAADTYTNLNARLALVTTSTEQFNAAQARLIAIAQSTRSPLEGTVDLYTRIARASQNIGATQSEVLQFVENVNRALATAGQAGPGVEAALVQLAQGLGSGTLRGDELNSILEQAPPLAEAIARGLGRSTAELRQLGSEGRLTSQAVFQALLNQTGRINAEFQKMPVTFSQGVTVMLNSLTLLIGRLDQATGFTQRLAGGLQAFAALADKPGETASRMLGVDDIGKLESEGKRIQNALELNMRSMERWRALAAQGNPQAEQEVERLRSAHAGLSKQLDEVTAKLRGIGQVQPAAPVDTDVGGRLRSQIRTTEADIATNAAKSWADLRKEYQATAEKQRAVEITIRAIGLAAGKTEVEIKKLIAASREKIDLKIGAATLESDLATFQRSMRTMVGDYEAAEKVLQAQRAAGLVGDREFYAERARLASLRGEVEIQALEREITRRRAEKLSGEEQIQNLQRIADLQAEIERKRTAGTAEQKVFGIEAKAATDEAAISSRQAAAAAREYINTFRLRRTRELDSFGQGDRERERLSRIAEVEDAYQAQIQDLTRERLAATNDEVRRRLDDQLQLIRSSRDEALQIESDSWRRRIEQERDGYLGMLEAVRNFQAESENVAKQYESLFSDMLRGPGEVIEQFVRTGKVSIEDLVRSWLASFARLKTNEFISYLLGSAFGAAGGAAANPNAAPASIPAKVPAAVGTSSAPRLASAAPASVSITNNYVRQPTSDWRTTKELERGVIAAVDQAGYRRV